jgi:hypothetical protein
MQGMRRRRQAQETAATVKDPQRVHSMGVVPAGSGTRLNGDGDGDVLAMVA